MIFGYVLVILGCFFLLQNMGLLPGLAWDYLWPSLLIVWGLTIILGKGRRELWCCRLPYREEEKDKP